MQSVTKPRETGDSSHLRETRLATAFDDLAEVLESVDLEEEPELAEAVIDALEATDEAYTLETWADGQNPRD